MEMASRSITRATYYITWRWADNPEELSSESSPKPCPSILSKALLPSPNVIPCSDPGCTPSPPDGETNKSEMDLTSVPSIVQIVTPECEDRDPKDHEGSSPAFGSPRKSPGGSWRSPTGS